MDLASTHIYLSEIQTQCEMALYASLVLDAAQHNRQQLAPLDLGNAAYFVPAHGILTHCANVSKLLWPSPAFRDAHRDEILQRGETLRGILAVHDGHALQSRDLRNHLEHFDERMDEWDRTTVHRVYVKDNVGPWGVIQGVADGDYMRWYDPQAQEVRFRGQAWSLRDLLAAVQDLRARAREAAVDYRQRAVALAAGQQ